MSSRVFQFTEDMGSPSSSEEAFFSQSFNAEVDFESGIVFQDLMVNSFEKKNYSLQPTSFNKVSVDVCASVMASVLSPERVSLLTESVSLLR